MFVKHYWLTLRIKKLPNKDPLLISAALKAITESPAVLAAITAIARGLYSVYSHGEGDQKKLRAICLDAFLCTMLTILISPAMAFFSSYFSFNLPEKTDLAIAVFIGYVGTETVRNLILKLIDRWFKI